MAKRYLRLVRFFLLSRLLLKPPSLASCCTSTVLCNSVSGSEHLYHTSMVRYCIIPVQYQTRAQDATIRARRAVESTRPFAGNFLPSHTAVSSPLLLRSSTSIMLARYGCLRMMGSVLMLGQCGIDWPYKHLQVMFDICVLADTAKATSLVSRSL